ncbi:hypothetical protein BU24DRAFT_207278 [Aaosphaeria arxii CBS 175.79]|uniref:Uncharacterized protein n=1 Tax=Aaosphaeria arxii CBS 175.79 TaxID=1450172 RepID=A0A6A5XUL6_9PLEO|nr:uncharacterized protein BU24DRAFT_207278 [Aaosphaeria arxii CBS 175.79]KAF2016643.1 hypothetical protein BU24DRAFT_207278 [Aaosphaeria arxii CBS 175.79]
MHETRLSSTTSKHARTPLARQQKQHHRRYSTQVLPHLSTSLIPDSFLDIQLTFFTPPTTPRNFLKEQHKMKRSDFNEREDVQTWRDRLLGKRLVTSDFEISEHTRTLLSSWMPRVYFNKPLREGVDGDMQSDVQPDSRLLRLPAEIRNHVLEYVLAARPLEIDGCEGDGIGGGVGREIGTRDGCAVIFCCKQLYIEGRALALEQHTYSFEKLPKKRSFAYEMSSEDRYFWDKLNVICDKKSNVITLVHYG